MFAHLTAHELYMLENKVLSGYQNANKVYFDAPNRTPNGVSGQHMSMDLGALAIEITDTF